jgi:acyl-CoA thioester hydrolase
MTYMERGGIPAPFTGHAATVRPEWIDENGHMNMAYYIVVFDGAIDHLWAAIGLGQPYRERTQHGTFAAESHIIYKTELLLGDEMQVSTQILAVDSKRIHLAHEMQRPDGTVVAQQEVMLLHVSLKTRRVVPFLPETAGLIAAAAQAHAALPRPDWVGRRVAMPVARPPA